jgi:hypothetical protein
MRYRLQRHVFPFHARGADVTNVHTRDLLDASVGNAADLLENLASQKRSA